MSAEANVQELLGAVFGKPRVYEHLPAARELTFSKRRKRPQGHCQICGIWRRSLHRDHVVPKRLGGADDDSNIQYICANCHDDKTSEDIKALWRDPEFRAVKRRGPYADKPITPEHRRKMSEAHRGVPLSEEHKRNLSASLKRTHQRKREEGIPIRGPRPDVAERNRQRAEARREAGVPNTRGSGWTHSEETRQKISDSVRASWARRKQEAAEAAS